MTARVIVLCLLVFLSLAASADTLTGKVVKITDGDTVYVLDANYQQHKIRLAGIDAPERKQAYGLASRKHLASLVARHYAPRGTARRPLSLLIFRIVCAAVDSFEWRGGSRSSERPASRRRRSKTR